jgi:HD-GYP domain-containing protein (c-di-GMP phosphodiesterase class II)
MVSDRHYRSKVHKDVAKSRLIDERDKQFDRAVVDCFIGIDEEDPALINSISEDAD